VENTNRNPAVKVLKASRFEMLRALKLEGNREGCPLSSRQEA